MSKQLTLKEQKDVTFLLRMSRVRGANRLLTQIKGHKGYSENVKQAVRNKLITKK